MSKNIEIKGKVFSEDTIVEALKAHCDWSEKQVFKVGDIIEVKQGELHAGKKRLVTKEDYTNLVAIDRNGHVHRMSPHKWDETYTIVGKCDGFKILDIPF